MSNTKLTTKQISVTSTDDLSLVINSLNYEVNSISELLTTNYNIFKKVHVKKYFSAYLNGSGDFYYDPTKLKSLHNGGTIISPTVPWNGLKGTSHVAFINKTGETDVSGTGCWVLEIPRDKIKASSFGMLADDDGTGTTGTENGAIWQIAMNYCASVNKRLLLDGSGYYLSTTVPLCPANFEMEFSVNSWVRFNGTRGLQLNSDLKLFAPKFKGAVIADCMAMYAAGGKENITIYDPKAINVGLILSNEGLTYSSADWATKTNISKNWTIFNPILKVVDYNPAVLTTAMLAIHCLGFKVYGGYSENYGFGFMYWGGDSAFGGDGAIGNARKTDGILVDGYSCKVYSAGCWGSMGDNNIRFVNCYAEALGSGSDVGFDHEGTIGAKNINCTAVKFNNGNYVTYAGYGVVENIGCTSLQVGGAPHYRNYNYSQDSNQSGEFRIIGGVYKRISGTGLCTIEDGGGCCKAFSMSGKPVIKDTRINFRANNIGSVDLNGVDIRLNDASVPDHLIEIITNASQRRVYRVSHCSVLLESGASYGAACRFFRIETNSFNYAQSVIVNDNEFALTQGDFVDSGTNPGIRGIVFCYNNRAGLMTKSFTTTALKIAQESNNYDSGGNAVAIT